MSTLKKPELRFSNYARFVYGTNGVLVYHSLFSSPVIINPQALPKLLDSNTSQLQNDDFDRIVQTLQDRYILVEAGMKERKLLDQKIKEHCDALKSGSQLRRLDIGVSEMCNFGCEHCIHAVSVGSPRGRKTLMGWETARNIIDKYMGLITKHGLRESEIHFGTVEPLINWRLIVKCVEYCEKVYPHIDHHFFVETNLSLLSMPLAEFFRTHSMRIVTSVDGYKDANDAIRVTAGGKGTFDLIARKCQLLREIGYPLSGFTITITDRNFHLVDFSIIEWALNMGMTEIDMDIDLLGSADLPVDQCVEKIISLHRRCLELGLKTTGTWKMPFVNLINKVPLVDSAPPSLCKSVGGQNIAVAPDGKIFICGHSSTVVGDLNQFDSLFDSESQFIQLISSRLSGQNEMCFGCEIESQCAGQCQVTREVSSRKEDTKKLKGMCDFYRKVTGILLRDKVGLEYPRNSAEFHIVFPRKE